ncbi:RNA methyltransferase PUA domain-containing protein, partial [Burkholderia sp. Ac-20349]|uniref:RNA methyltransferase PUA domain-containing protein n=1 Tax=Burkholderia sp. Ac-20349 TaxID=2703893 RepID=UPI003217D808
MNEATTTAAVPRFFVDAALRADATLALPADVARHAQVLRLQPGDVLALFDGTGGQYRARLVEIDKRSALAQMRVIVRRQHRARMEFRVAEMPDRRRVRPAPPGCTRQTMQI